MLKQAGGERSGVFYDAGGVGAKLRPHRLPEGNRFCGDHVHERASLHSGKHRAVESAGVFGRREDEAASRTAERLVRRRGDEMRVGDGVRVNAACHEPGDVRHVHHEVRPDLVGDLPEGGEVDHPRIGACSRDDHPRPVFPSETANLVHVDPVGHGIDAVAHHAVHLP